jgi:tight adherence protein C
MELVVPAAVFFLVFMAAVAVMRRSNPTLERLERHSIMPAGAAATPSQRQRTTLIGAGGEVSAIAGVAARLVREEARTKSGQILREAGEPMSLSSFLVMRVLFAFVLAPLFIFWVWTSYGTSMLGIIMLVVGGFTIPQLPMMRIKRKARKRSKEIDRSLPDALDLLVVSAEGGLSLDGSIQQVAMRTRGLLATEFERLLQEINGGMSRRDALLSLTDRSGSENLKIFCTTIIQADKMGMSIANTLRTLADTMRMRRRQAAETQARKAPIKMMPFLVFFMIPALFVVILGPAALSIIAFIKNS